MSYKVIQWATGHVGLAALRAIIEDPDLDLVGVRVYSESKDGVDAGELCGLSPTGVKATRDVDALLALGADCVCYTAMESDGIEPVLDDFVRILESGTNVVASTLLPLVFPPSMPELMGDAEARLEAAGRKGGATIHVTGVNPGCLLDVIPPLLASGVLDLESIAVAEHFPDISCYQEGALAKEMFGLSMSPQEWDAMLEVRQMMMTEYFGSALKLLAHGLGGTTSEIRAEIRRFETDEELKLPGLALPAGSVAAIHAQLDCSVGATSLTYHEYVSAYESVKRPGWPEPPGGSGGYLIEIVGRPRMQVEIGFEAEGRHPMAEAFVYTSHRLVNAIAPVCAAEPGVSQFLEVGRAVVGYARRS